MKRIIALVTLAALISTPALAEWKRQETTTTPRGTFTGQQSGSCANGTCTRNGVRTGPNGKSITSSGTATQTGPGQYSSSGTVTGPNGQTVTRSSNTNCADGSCTRTGTVTGPNGQTVTHTGTTTTSTGTSGQ